MNTTKRFSTSATCASCKGHIEKEFEKHNDIEINFNLATKILKVTTDFSKYNDTDIIKIVKDAGYKAELL